MRTIAPITRALPHAKRRFQKRGRRWGAPNGTRRKGQRMLEAGAATSPGFTP
jgi:hypothetical protein